MAPFETIATLYGGVLLLATAPAFAATSSSAARLDATPSCRAEDRIAGLDVTSTPPAPRAGEPTLVTFRMDVACSAAITWRVEAEGRVLASGSNQAPTPPARLLTVASTWTPSVSGEHVLRATADPDNALGETESARKNNTVARAVTVTPRSPEPREPEPPPLPAPSAPPDIRGDPGSKSTCTAWERRIVNRGDGLIAVRRARGGPASFDYVECGRRLAAEIMKTYCSPSERKQLVKKPWFLQPGDLALVAQTIDCR